MYRVLVVPSDCWSNHQNKFDFWPNSQIPAVLHLVRSARSSTDYRPGTGDQAQYDTQPTQIDPRRFDSPKNMFWMRVDLIETHLSHCCDKSGTYGKFESHILSLPTVVSDLYYIKMSVSFATGGWCSSRLLTRVTPSTGWQGLTLVHCSAQLEPFLTQNTP